VAVVAQHRQFHAALAEVGQALATSPGPGGPVAVLGGLAFEPRSAEQLRGEWGGRLDRSLLLRTARDLAGRLTGSLPAATPRAGRAQAAPAVPPATGGTASPRAARQAGGPATAEPAGTG